jgi:hypothetical protein
VKASGLVDLWRETVTFEERLRKEGVLRRDPDEGWKLLAVGGWYGLEMAEMVSRTIYDKRRVHGTPGYGSGASSPPPTCTVHNNYK